MVVHLVSQLCTFENGCDVCRHTFELANSKRIKLQNGKRVHFNSFVIVFNHSLNSIKVLVEDEIVYETFGDQSDIEVLQTVFGNSVGIINETEERFLYEFD